MDRMRILLVEDETMIRALVAEVLCDAGFEVIQARDGDQALGILEQIDKVHLLLTDMQMPGRADGNAVAERAKQIFPGLPVIYATGRPETLTNSIGGNDGVVGKPFGPKEILAMAERLLRACGGTNTRQGLAPRSGGTAAQPCYK